MIQILEYTQKYQKILNYYHEFDDQNSDGLAEMKAVAVSMGSWGWSVDCSGFGTDCWDKILETHNKWKELN